MRALGSDGEHVALVPDNQHFLTLNIHFFRSASVILILVRVHDQCHKTHMFSLRSFREQTVTSAMTKVREKSERTGCWQRMRSCEDGVGYKQTVSQTVGEPTHGTH